MCIRDSYKVALELIPCTTQTLAKGPQQNVKGVAPKYLQRGKGSHIWDCLLYTSDAADERSSVDLGGRRIIKKNYNKGFIISLTKKIYLKPTMNTPTDTDTVR